MAKYTSGRQKNLKVGISSYSENLTSLEVIGNGYFTGIVTAGYFRGDGSGLTNLGGSSAVAYASTAGIATYATFSGYASTAGIATYATSSGYASTAGIATSATRLQNARTFQITGDIVGSPISFDGTGNVSIAATIQPNSVALGSDTTGDYVQSITGTANQISVSVTSGESTTPVISIPNQFTIPQDATVTGDLQVNRNLNVTGNITLGGTTAFLNVQELKIADPDIVLGVRTDGSGNDISNDTTSNHGGVALASTEGTPLVDLFIAGIETNPSTYKKIMWFKSGTFAGLGTDAWLINYAVGIGSTQFPTGTRLAAGNVQFTQNDLAVVRNINSSGVITATTFYGTLSGYASTAGIATYATSSGYATTAGIATVAQGLTGTPNINVGVVTATSYNGSGTNLTGIVTSIVAGTGITIGPTNGTGQVTIYSTSQSVPSYALVAGIATYATVAGVATYATNAGIATYATSSGIATYADNAGISSTLTSTASVNTSGIITASSFTGSGIALTGIVTSIVAGTGITIGPTNGTGQVTIYSTAAGGSVAFADKSGISTSVIGGIASVTQLYVNSGFSTFTGVTTFTSSVYFNGAYFGDNDNLYIGDNNDLRIYHSGGNAYIKDVGRGELILSSDGNGISLRKFADADQYMAEFLTSGPVKLYYNNANKFETLSVGATVTGTFFSDQISVGGTITATTFRGSGTNLTGIVTSIVAGTGITIGPTNGTGQVTIYSTASAGITTYVDNAGIATYASRAGIATYATTSGVSTNVIGGIASVTSLSVSGITTLGVVTAGNIYSTGIITATSINFASGGVLGDLYSDGGIGIGLKASPANYYAVVASNNLQQYIQVDDNQIFIGTGYASITGTYDWKFDKNGALTFPDNTIQYTAFTGYAPTAGIATYASIAGISTYATSAGIATYATNAGIATYATNAGVSTALQYSRTISLSGDIVGFGTFDGTQNVSIAATIQPNSVALGSDTTGDYVQSITGTSNQISVSVTSGEGSTPVLSLPEQFTIPQDATVTRDLQVNRNLNVNGNITLGGTTAFLNVQQLKISDPDIVIGVRTDAFGNDVSNDTTANHGGIAVASTEGSPLVNLNIAGIETLPATYKKIMWFKSGSFSGLGTDAWLINYGVGIGSTQVPNGVRLAVGGIQMTDSTITATTFSGTLSGYATSAGIATNLAGGSAGVIPYQSNTGITSFTQVGTAGSILVSDGTGTPYWGSITSGGGIGGITIRDDGTSLATNISSLNFVGSNVTATTSGVAATITVSNNLVGTALSISGISTFGNTTTGVVINGTTGIITSTNPGVTTVTYYGDGSKLSGISVGVVTYVSNAGLATYVKGGLAGNILYQSAENITAFLTNGSPGTILQSNGSGNAPSWVSAAPSDAISGLTVRDETTLVGDPNSISTFNFVGENVTATASAGIATITILGSSTNIVGSALSISGISTFTNGPVLIGGGTSTGTVSQSLQVTGISSNVYIGGGLGVGVTNNTTTGNIVVSGTVTANSDAKLKTNVKTIENALDKVLSLRGVEYDRIDTGDHQIGLIAQEVEKIIPQVVYPKSSSPDYETKSVSYQNIVGLLIEAIKEQDKRILELERKLGEN